jgi:hypothetical protein
VSQYDSIKFGSPRQTETEIGPELAPAIFQPLTTPQAAALDLYRRGLNVFPLPSAWEWNWKSAGMEPKKPPYSSTKPLFMNRLHICGPECERRTAKSGALCLPESATFEALFDHANLGVMTGRTSGNLLAFDCDSQPAYKRMRRELDKRGLNYWAFNSHRGGAYVMRLEQGEAANTPCSLGKVEIWGNSHYLVFPPSVHPLGTIYQWRTGEPYYTLPIGEPPPVVSIDQVADLGVKLLREAGPKGKDPELYDLPDWTIRLSQANRDIAAYPPNEGIRNIQLTALTYDVAALIDSGDLPRLDGLAFLVNVAERCVPPYGPRDIAAMLKSALKKGDLTRAVDYYNDDHTVTRQPAPWEIAFNWARSKDWSGRTAQTDRAVFLACCERARLDGRARFRASTRELAEISNMKRKTATRALHRLCGASYLRRVATDQRSGANVFTFGAMPLNMDPIITTCILSGDLIEGQKHELPETEAEQDLFGRLGKIAWRVWMHLIQQAEPSSAYYAIDRLISVGLVTFNPADGHYFGETQTEKGLQTRAAALGALGKSAKRKRLHQRERERQINLALARARDRWRRGYLAWRREQEAKS